MNIVSLTVKNWMNFHELENVSLHVRNYVIGANAVGKSNFLDVFRFLRWMDIRDGNPDMLRAMIFDPDKQDWDDTALSIGRSVCDVFCPYYEANAFEEALGRVA